MISLSLERPIPFDNLSSQQLEERTKLQVLLRQLNPGQGQLLIAHYSGPKHPKSDAENLLFYNIGNTCFASALRYGLQFEECSMRTLRSEYRYQVAKPATTPDSWRRISRLADFAEIILPAPNDRWAHQVWLNLRRARLPGAAIHQGPFEVALDLRSPTGAPAKLGPDKVKKLLDGLVTAYQWDARGRNVAEACARLAKHTGGSAHQLRALLCDSAGAVLGTPGELLAVYRQGIKWNPDDHHCVAGTVKWCEGHGASWSLSGEIWSLEPISGP